MKVTGIIAEYNPFHKGHEYHIRLAKEKTGADYCIVILSGNFVQRGAPALADKYIRTRSALSGGADLVLELPVPYACASAEFFADGAVRILNGLQTVDFLCFGSETGETMSLEKTAALLTEETAEYKEALQRFLKSGLSFPKARNLALLSLTFAQPDKAELEAHLKNPNNILGLEYCKALQRQGSPIKPVAVKREGSHYHDTGLSPKFSSASAIRAALKNSDISKLREHLPASSYENLKAHWGQTCPVVSEDFSLLMHYALLQHSAHAGNFDVFADITGDLSDKIKKNLPSYRTLSSFCESLKTKDITASRIRRCLFHILLGTTKEQMHRYTAPTFPGYARILGFRQEAAALLSHLKKQTGIPLVSKPADAKRILGDTDAFSMFAAETYACTLYNAVLTNKYGVSMPHEYTNSVIIL